MVLAPLSTLVDLAAQKFLVPANKLEYLLSLALGGPTRPRPVSWLKGLIANDITSSWGAVGYSTRVRTREMDRVIELLPPALSFSRLEGASLQLSPARREKIRCWLWNLCRVSGQAIRPRPVPARIDRHMFSDASGTCTGAVILVEGPEVSASSVVRALQWTAPPGNAAGMPHVELVKRSPPRDRVHGCVPPAGAK